MMPYAQTTLPTADTNKTRLRHPDRYGREYLNWHAPIGEFGGWANQIKFEKWLSPDLDVLDFGCGGGWLLASLPGRRKLGVEVNPEARRTAENLGLATVSDLAEVAPESYDRVISNNALEHVQDPFSALRQIRDKIRPGGLLVLVVPCETIRMRFRKNEPNRHLFSWSPQALGNLAQDAGFQVLSCEPFIHKWPPRFQMWARLLGPSAFHLLCRCYGRWETSWTQVHLVARKPSADL